MFNLNKETPVTTEEVAQYILAKYIYEKDFTGNKLKLLLFYCQVHTLILLEKPLFEDSDFVIIGNTLTKYDFRGKKADFLEEFLFFEEIERFASIQQPNNRIKCLTLPMKHNLSQKQKRIIDNVLDSYGNLSIEELDYMFTIDKYILLKIKDFENTFITLTPKQVKERLNMTIQEISTIN